MRRAGRGAAARTRAGHPSGSQHGGWRLDVTGLLTIWLVLLFGLSASQIVGPLGALGPPAMMVASTAALAWIASRFVPWLGADRGLQPLRPAIHLYLWYLFATVVIAQTRPLTALETTGSIRAVIEAVAYGGVALLVMDGITRLDRLTVLLRRLMWGGAYLAGLGIIQFFTGFELLLDVPGLTINADSTVPQRSIFNRPFGTALHPIEFSVVLAALLPLALHFAITAPAGSTQRRAARIAAAMIAFGVPISISRSGLVAFTAAMLILGLGWSWKRRFLGMAVFLAAVPFLWLLVPGLVGTLRSLFTGAQYDPSIQARLDRLPRIMALIREKPFFGRGLGTFSVDDYFLIDNEVWVTTIELGIVGLILTVALLLLAGVMAVTSKHHRYATPVTAHLGYAIAAGIGALAVSMSTFDALFYHIFRGVLFVLLGAAGALWRLTREPNPSTTAIASQPLLG